MNTCEQKACRFWNGKICTDKIEYINALNGGLCCRFHPNAQLRVVYNNLNGITERIKVLTKQEIKQLLDEGYVLRYSAISAKVYIQTPGWVIIGAVRFDTYLKMLHSLKRIKCTSTTEELYIKE